MKCSICNKEIVLVPSAAERAQKFGGKPSDYTSLFTTHVECKLKEDKKSLNELMKRLDNSRIDVFYP